MTEREAMGPISYLIVEFPGSKMTGEGFSILVDLVDKGVIRILDLRFITRDLDGSVRALELADIDRDGRSTWPCSTVFRQDWSTKVTLLTPLPSSNPARPPGS